MSNDQKDVFPDTKRKGGSPGSATNTGFDPKSLRIADLRRIFAHHDIEYNVSGKKAEMISVFRNEISPRAAELYAREIATPGGEGIVDAGAPKIKSKKEGKEKKEKKEDKEKTTRAPAKRRVTSRNKTPNFRLPTRSRLDGRPDDLLPSRIFLLIWTRF